MNWFPSMLATRLPLPIEYSRVRRVVHQAFVRKEIHAEQMAHALDVWHRTGQEMPGVRIGVPLARVLGQLLRLVARRIEGHRQQHEIAADSGLESTLEDVEVIGDAEAELRQRTARVDEVDRHDLAAQRREGNRMPRLIDQREVRDRLTEPTGGTVDAESVIRFSCASRCAVSGSCSDGW